MSTCTPFMRAATVATVLQDELAHRRSTLEQPQEQELIALEGRHEYINNQKAWYGKMPAYMQHHSYEQDVRGHVEYNNTLSSNIFWDDRRVAKEGCRGFKLDDHDWLDPSFQVTAIRMWCLSAHMANSKKIRAADTVAPPSRRVVNRQRRRMWDQFDLPLRRGVAPQQNYGPTVHVPLRRGATDNKGTHTASRPLFNHAVGGGGAP